MVKTAGIELCRGADRRDGARHPRMKFTDVQERGDNCDVRATHMLPAMARRSHEAKGSGPDGGDARIRPWDTGSPRRAWLRLDDLAAVAVVLTADLAAVDAGDGFVDTEWGGDGTISDLASIVRRVVGRGGVA